MRKKARTSKGSVKLFDEHLNLSRIRLENTGGVVHLPLTPVAKPRMTQRDKWCKRPIVEKYWQYKRILRLMLPAGYTLPEVCLIRFYLPAPKSWSKKKTLESHGEPHRQKPDIDNLIKALLDAIYEEDAQVWRIHAEKRWDAGEFGWISIRSE